MINAKNDVTTASSVISAINFRALLSKRCLVSCLADALGHPGLRIERLLQQPAEQAGQNNRQKNKADFH